MTLIIIDIDSGEVENEEINDLLESICPLCLKESCICYELFIRQQPQLQIREIEYEQYLDKSKT